MTHHTLKTVGTVWDAVEQGAKRWEVRRNDRFFQSGDTVTLRRLDEVTGGYSRTKDGIFLKELNFRIGWMLQGGQFGIETGYCVFSLEPMEDQA